ncbi:signal peptidase I [Aeromicrobium sp. NPDC092404]|uniref:signal peptidase I n=1 Tax=Aeromicrobium sp. NPDC092404 TaxID=3154976 RepID=UPI003430992B
MSISQHRRPRHTVRRLVSAAINVLLLVTTLLGVCYFAPVLLGYERYVITGGSMSGTFEKGSLAFEKNVPVEDLAVGDIITYQPPADSGVTTLVTHRISAIKAQADGQVLFRTKGDANADPDPWTFTLVQADQPVVRHTVPHVGWVFIRLADPGFRTMAIGIPAGLIALASAVEIIGVLRAARRRPEELPADHAPLVVREPVHV